MAGTALRNRRSLGDAAAAMARDRKVHLPRINARAQEAPSHHPKTAPKTDLPQGRTRLNPRPFPTQEAKHQTMVSYSAVRKSATEATCPLNTLETELDPRFLWSGAVRQQTRNPSRL